MKTIFDPRYELLINQLIALRESKGETQTGLSEKLGKPQSYIGKIETKERRLDSIELLDWLKGLGVAPQRFFKDIGWIPHSDVKYPVPLRATVDESPGGIFLNLASDESVFKVELEGVTKEQYIKTEERIVSIFSQLNTDKPLIKNRNAIAQAIELAIRAMPDTNPSDIYHHIIYRLYLREYYRSDPGQSWVRAGGEALELFMVKWYNELLAPYQILLQPLTNEEQRKNALSEIGIYGTVGNSKLDIALYSTAGKQPVMFGGIHCKASLAERVSDDVPCSEAMMRKGYLSCLFTFDAKSYPPPTGDLVNRGEFGTIDAPSDKRRYIEEHGSFDVCFSYNLRTVASPEMTLSGKRIFVSAFDGNDPLPGYLVSSWERFREDQKQRLK